MTNGTQDEWQGAMNRGNQADKLWEMTVAGNEEWQGKLNSGEWEWE